MAQRSARTAGGVPPWVWLLVCRQGRRVHAGTFRSMCASRNSSMASIVSHSIAPWSISDSDVCSATSGRRSISSQVHRMLARTVAPWQPLGFQQPMSPMLLYDDAMIGAATGCQEIVRRHCPRGHKWALTNGRAICKNCPLLFGSLSCRTSGQRKAQMPTE